MAYAAEPSLIAAYARCKYTRSTLIRTLLGSFNLSRNSIVTSDDAHASLLKPLLMRHLPDDDRCASMARGIVDGALPGGVGGPAVRTVNASAALIPHVYTALLEDLLGVTLTEPLRLHIARLELPEVRRTLRVERLMYGCGLHRRALFPVRFAFEAVFFPEAVRLRRIVATLEERVFHLSWPKDGSWFQTLQGLHASGTISRPQFRGEITSVLVSSLTLTSVVASALLCLAAMPRYVEKIRRDPGFSRLFLLEVLRLYPPFRQFGYERLGGSRGGREPDLVVLAATLHRRAGEWPSPNRFWPERFLQPGAKAGCKYLPFGMGRRACPARGFSMRIVADVLLFVCSPSSGISLVKRDALPEARRGSLLSFPREDGLSFARARQPASRGGRAAPA